jgi:hypothetical protein
MLYVVNTQNLWTKLSNVNYHSFFICPHELPILYCTLMNYHFVTKDPLPLVKDVKLNGQLYCLRHTIPSVNNTIHGTIHTRPSCLTSLTNGRRSLLTKL